MRYELNLSVASLGVRSCIPSLRQRCLITPHYEVGRENVPPSSCGRARGRLQWHSSFLNIDSCISVKDCRAVFGSASCWKNGSAFEGPP